VPRSRRAGHTQGCACIFRHPYSNRLVNRPLCRVSCSTPCSGRAQTRLFSLLHREYKHQAHARATRLCNMQCARMCACYVICDHLAAAPAPRYQGQSWPVVTCGVHPALAERREQRRAHTKGLCVRPTRTGVVPPRIRMTQPPPLPVLYSHCHSRPRPLPLPTRLPDGRPKIAPTAPADTSN